MRKPEKPTKSEWVLLGITAAFLCLVGTLFWQDRAAVAPGLTVQTETESPQEEVVPETVLEAAQDSGPVNINTADAAELEQLPGIGEVLAGRIIAYREANGPFESVEELLEVSGIGEARLAALEGLITVEDETS